MINLRYVALDRGGDWEAGIEQLLNCPTPSLYLHLSHFAHIVACDASREGIVLYYPDRTEQITSAERQDVRTAITNQIERDWPAYMSRLASSGKLHHTERRDPSA